MTLVAFTLANLNPQYSYLDNIDDNFAVNVVVVELFNFLIFVLTKKSTLRKMMMYTNNKVRQKNSF